MTTPSHSPSPRRWLTLAIVASALFMICVDMTVLYTALPVLTRELQADAESKLWIVNIYSLVVAGLLPAGTEYAANGTRPDHGDAQPVQLARRRVGITHGLPIEKPAMCASVL